MESISATMNHHPGLPPPFNLIWSDRNIRLLPWVLLLLILLLRELLVASAFHLVRFDITTHRSSIQLSICAHITCYLGRIFVDWRTNQKRNFYSFLRCNFRSTSNIVFFRNAIFVISRNRYGFHMISCAKTSSTLAENQSFSKILDRSNNSKNISKVEN